MPESERDDVTAAHGRKRNMIERPRLQDHHKRSLDTMGALYEDVEKFFGDIFALYGRLVVRRPLPFVLLPLIVCSALGFGMLTMTYETDVQKLYTPEQAKSLQDYKQLTHLFRHHDAHDSDGRFYSYQQLNVGHFLEIIMVTSNIAKCSNSSHAYVIPEDVKEMVEVFNDITHRKIRVGDTRVTYNDVCAQRHGICVIDGIESLATLIRQRNCSDYDVIAGDGLNPLLSGLSLCVNRTDSSCKPHTELNNRAIWLRFNLRRSDVNMTQTVAWESAMEKRLSPHSARDHLQLTYRTSTSLNDAITTSSYADVSLFAYSVVVMTLYGALIGAGMNWVSNHVTLALAGVVATLMSIVAACGVTALCGVPFVNMSGLMPFLILGIGVDDMFQLLTQWRHTSVLDAIDARLGVTMRSAAVALTITSLADILAFCIGATSPFSSVKFFCALSGVAIFFCYFNLMTFFTGCLVLHARRVEANRHCVTCLPVMSRAEMRERARDRCCIAMCSGHRPRSTNEEAGICKPLSRAFYAIYPRLLLHWITKTAVVVLFAVYVCVSIWAVTRIETGFRFNSIVPEESDLSRFLAAKQTHQSQRGPVVMLAIVERIEYHKPEMRDKIDDVLREAGQFSNVIANATISWLNEFHRFTLERNLKAPTSEAEFVKRLLHDFLPANQRFYDDLRFSDDNKSIDASRFYVFARTLRTAQQEAGLLRDAALLAGSSSLPLLVYSTEFVFYEHYVSIVKDTLLVVGVAVFGLLFIALVFIPHPIAISCVTLTMFSVTLGMLAFMTLCGLELSAITTMQIILSVTICTDSAVHVSHAFMTATGKNRNERVTVAIEKVGMSILNGGVSLLLSVGLLVFAESYIYTSFCKSIFIVLALVWLHSLVFLPVLLSFVGPRRTSKPRVFIPVSNSARSLQDTYRANSLTRPTDRDLEQFRAERLARLNQMSSADSGDDHTNASPTLQRSVSASQLRTPADDASMMKLTPIHSRRVSFAVGDRATVSTTVHIDGCFGKTAAAAAVASQGKEDMSTVTEQSEEDGAPDAGVGAGARLTTTGASLTPDADDQSHHRLAVFTIGSRCSSPAPPAGSQRR